MDRRRFCEEDFSVDNRARFLNTLAFNPVDETPQDIWGKRIFGVKPSNND